jgi:multidrug resistance efflux pump
VLARDGTPSLSDRVRSLRLPDAPAGGGPGMGLVWVLVLWVVGLTAGVAYLGYAYVTTRDALQDLAKPAAGGDAQAKSTGGTALTSPSATGAVEVASSGDVALESKGYVMAAHLILVSPKVGGMVTKLPIEEGMRVKKGDVLAELEDIDYKAERDRAKATLESARQRLLELERGNRPEEIQQAKAELDEADAQREQLYLDWKRNTNLKTGSALAAKDYELALSQYKAMERRVEKLRQAHKLMVDGPRVERIEAARGEVRQAEADLVKAQWRLDNCKVTAPVSGTILSKKAEEGNMVNPSAFSNGLSASLCEMADLSDLEIDLSIQERDIAKVFKGQRCQVRAEAFPDRVYAGVVSRVMPVADRAKGALPVRVKVTVPREEEGVYLKPDMGTIVAFLKGKP